MPEGARREGKRRCPPDKDGPRGTREKRFLKANSGWECPKGRGGGGKTRRPPDKRRGWEDASPAR
eukprot:3168459-Karenia_brevis.AAC.1